MQIDEVNYLKLTGRAEDKSIDGLKRWLAGGLETVDFNTPSATDLVMALIAARDHYGMDLLIHSDSLIRQAQTDEYGPLEIVGGDNVFKKGNRFDWDNVKIETIAKASREQAVNVLKRIRKDIMWLRKQIRRLERTMEQAKKQREMGIEAFLEFEAEERPGE